MSNEVHPRVTQRPCKEPCPCGAEGGCKRSCKDRRDHAYTGCVECGHVLGYERRYVATVKGDAHLSCYTAAQCASTSPT